MYYYNQTLRPYNLSRLQQCSLCSPVHPLEYLRLAESYYALKNYEKAIEIKSDYYQAIFNKGNVFFELKIWFLYFFKAGKKKIPNR